MYGLSGPLQDIFDGKYSYGHRPESQGNCNINTCLRIWDTPTDILCKQSLCLPILSVVSLLGYEHMFQHITIDFEPSLLTLLEYGNIDNNERSATDEIASVEILYWIIMTNKSKRMVNLLTTQGVQFRWLTNESLLKIFHKLFEDP